MESRPVFMCAEKQWSVICSLHALIEMVEPTHQSRLAGGGFKPPKGAMVKSYGTERLGKGLTKSRIRYG